MHRNILGGGHVVDPDTGGVGAYAWWLIECIMVACTMHHSDALSVWDTCYSCRRPSHWTAIHWLIRHGTFFITLWRILSPFCIMYVVVLQGYRSGTSCMSPMCTRQITFSPQWIDIFTMVLSLNCHGAIISPFHNMCVVAPNMCDMAPKCFGLNEQPSFRSLSVGPKWTTNSITFI